MKNKILNVIPYYGGKAKMNDFITDLLDYRHSSIYIEPFAGGARTLLNKPRHELEAINDLSTGIYALFYTLTQEETAIQLMKRLYQTSYTAEDFQWALDYRNELEDNATGEIKRQLIDYIKQMERKYGLDLWSLFIKHGNDDSFYRMLAETEVSLYDRQRAYRLLKKYTAVKGSIGLADLTIYDCTKEKGYDRIEHAAATYLVYRLSRDAMGKHFRKNGAKNNEAYYKQVDKLLDAHYRLKGVQVFSKDAYDFFQDGENALLYNKDVMMYCDPTYLSDEDVETYIKSREDYNPGAVYKNYWTYSEHEEFLKKVQNAECKMLISNYRDRTHLYDTYLNADNGWKSIEYETVTTVGGGAKRRTEVLWLNY